MPDVMPGVLAAPADAAADAILRLEQVTKSYGQHIVLHGIDLAMRRGEFLTLLGPSGCGKTTTLNMVAGLVTPSSGTIWLRGRAANTLPPRRRELGLVFQSWALFPHMTVFENVAYGLRVRGLGREEIRRRVGEMREIVRLPAAAARYPSQLSGGMQQRVALARALVPRPDLLLLDEPLSNLDAALRKEMQIELRRIHDALGVSTLLVTHSQEEALVLSDRIAVMNAGHIVCLDTPQRVYENPPDAFVYRFLGDANIFSGEVVGQSGDTVLVACGTLLLQARGSAARGCRLAAAFRPENVTVSAWRGDGIAATVTGAVFMGGAIAYRLDAGGQEIRALTLPPEDGVVFAPGSRVAFAVPPSRITLLHDG